VTDTSNPSADPEEAPGPSPPPVPSWLRTLVVIVALVWGTLEVTFLGARPASFAFILAVLFGTVGVGVLRTIQGVLR
jgi:hypothetical protein